MLQQWHGRSVDNVHLIWASPHFPLPLSFSLFSLSREFVGRISYSVRYAVLLMAHCHHVLDCARLCSTVLDCALYSTAASVKTIAALRGFPFSFLMLIGLIHRFNSSV